MRALGSIFKDDGKAEKATNKRLVAKIKSGETLTADELAYRAVNWAPVTHYYYLGRYAIARTKKARSRAVRTVGQRHELGLGIHSLITRSNNTLLDHTFQQPGT